MLWFCTASSTGEKKQTLYSDQSSFVKRGNKNVAVLELFTSQGCSSCPPADRLLATYRSKENVIVLSFHVDYWNRLGWTDPFSSKAFTQRQYHYASVMHTGVYTPQLFINGQDEMVGSDDRKISRAVKKVLEEPAGAALSIKTVKAEDGQVSVNFVASGNIRHSIVHIALIQKMATTAIKSGENQGLTIANYDIVRNFRTISDVIDGDNTSAISIPAGTDQKDMAVAILLQEKNTNKVSAADQAALQ